jgi:hypothetical protein
MRSDNSSLTTSLLIALAAAVLVSIPFTPSPAEPFSIFDDINTGLLSIGGRATYFDPKDADYPVQVSGLIYPFTTKRLSPFLLGGGGWYYTTVKGPGGFDDTQNRFGLHAGGGLQFWLNNHFSVDSTYRYIWLEKVESKDQNIVDKNSTTTAIWSPSG